MTNRELMEKGRSPIDPKTGEKIELHHMGQKSDAPFAELTENTEHGGQNHGTLHPKRSDSWRNVEGAKENYATEKTNHWKTRAQEGQGIAA
ncbi:MAG: HNH/ENDO VII family nuclease [Lentisphaeria bacterium]